MGNEVTMGEALVVTVVSMSVVFVVLVLISLTIGLLKSMSEKKETKEAVPAKQEKPVAKEVTDTQTPEEDEEELIAVITAAIANSLGVDIPEINIRSIRRTPQATTVWREIGKQEQIMGRL